MLTEGLAVRICFIVTMLQVVGESVHGGQSAESCVRAASVASDQRDVRLRHLVDQWESVVEQELINVQITCQPVCSVFLLFF